MNKYFFALLLALVFASCERDPGLTPTPPTVEEPGIHETDQSGLTNNTSSFAATGSGLDISGETFVNLPFAPVRSDFMPFCYEKWQGMNFEKAVSVNLKSLLADGLSKKKAKLILNGPMQLRELHRLAMLFEKKRSKTTKNVEYEKVHSAVFAPHRTHAAILNGPGGWGEDTMLHIGTTYDLKHVNDFEYRFTAFVDSLDHRQAGTEKSNGNELLRLVYLVQINQVTGEITDIHEHFYRSNVMQSSTIYPTAPHAVFYAEGGQEHWLWDLPNAGAAQNTGALLFMEAAGVSQLVSGTAINLSGISCAKFNGYTIERVSLTPTGNFVTNGSLRLTITSPGIGTQALYLKSQGDPNIFQYQIPVRIIVDGELRTIGSTWTHDSAVDEAIFSLGTEFDFDVSGNITDYSADRDCF